MDITTASSHTLYDLEKLFRENNKDIVKSYGSFIKLMEKVGPPETPAPAPTTDDFIGKKPNIPEEFYKIP